jgi:hypothetical protein
VARKRKPARVVCYRPQRTASHEMGASRLHVTLMFIGAVCSLQPVASRYTGSAVAEAVIRWLPTAAARVRVRAEHVGFVVDKAELGQVFSEYFCLPCQSSFHQFLHHHNHPGLAQLASWLPQCRVDPIGLHPPLYQFKFFLFVAIPAPNLGSARQKQFFFSCSFPCERVT